MKVVFFGTPPFAAATLASLLEKGIDVVGVVTRQDKPVGRSGKPQPTSVKKIAKKLRPDLPIFQPKRASDPESAEALAALNADLFIVVAYGQIIKENLLTMPSLGCINVHASLLPKYRGAAPIQRAIMEGEKETGVTIMHMAKELDAGDIIRMASVEIGDRTHGELEEVLCKLGCETLLQTLQDFEHGSATRKPQEHSATTYAHKITPEDGLISFSDHSATELYNQIRGVTPSPGAWCWVEVRGSRKRMKILRAHPAPGQPPAYGKKEWIVACQEGALSLDEVQLEGKKAMQADEFMRGFPVKSFFIM